MKLSVEVKSSKLKQKLSKRRDSLSRQTANHILEGVTKRTPVKTGRARAGWKLRKISDGYEIYNNVPYIGYLEKAIANKQKRHDRANTY